MPLKTFLNLTEEKQKEIINVCLHEFSLYDYESASLTRIVDKLGIAKGSFYRYFENKQALYLYLIEFSKVKTSECGQKVFETSTKNFFDTFMDYFVEMMSLEEAYPMIIRFKFRYTRDSASGFYGDIRTEAIKEKTDRTKVFIENGQENKTLRTDVSSEILSMVAQYYQVIIVDYLTVKYKLKYDEPISFVWNEEVSRDVNTFMDILKNGIAR